MKKKITGWGWMMLSVLLATSSAVSYAEVFQGEIKNVNTDEATVVRKDPVTGIASLEEQQVRTSKKTKFGNLQSLTDLRPGDAVEIDGKWNRKKGYWKAKSVSVEKVKLSDDTKKKSNSEIS